MLGDHLTLVQDADLVAAGTDRDWPAHELRWCRIAVAVEFNPRVRADDRRYNFVGIERDRWQRSQQRALLLETVRGPLASRLVQPHVGHLVAPLGRQCQVVLETGQVFGTPSQ